MGSAGSVSKEQLTEEQVKAMIERFCYLDENNDGTISLEELKLEHRNFDGDAYDEAAIDAEFKKLDANHDGSVSLVEYLTSRGVDLKSFKAEHAERQRQAVLAEQALIREQGVSAVEIIPDGQEAATCQAVAEAAFVNAAIVGDDAMRCAGGGAREDSRGRRPLSLSFSLSLSRPLSSSSSSSSSPLLSSLLPPSSRSSMRLLPRSHDRYTAIKWPVAPDHNPQRTGCMAQHSRAHATQSRPASHHHRGPDISPKNSATHLTQEELARSVRTLDHQNYADAGRAQPNQNPARPEPSSAPTPRRWWPQRPPGRHPKTRQATQPQGK